MDPSDSQKKIPRFASFKPQISAPTIDATGPRDRHQRKHEEREHISRHKSEHRSRHGRTETAERPVDRRERRDKWRSETHAVTEAVRKELPSASPTVSTTAQDGQDFYFIDRAGDRHNLIYGTLHRYSVPAYHRTGRGSVLGLPRRYKIDRDSSTGDSVVILPGIGRHEAKRSKLKDGLLKSNKQRPRLLRARPEFVEDPGKAIGDFIPLGRDYRERESGLGGLDSDEDRYAYRSIQGKAKDVDHPETDTTGDEDAPRDPDEEIKRLNAELLRAVDNTPEDVDAWIRLIDHQEVLLTGARTESRLLSQAERTSLADIRLSLYDKALKKVGPSAQRDRLLIGRMEEGMQLWEKKKVADQWQSTLRANPQFVSLWVRYLDYRQTEFLDFTYERCLTTLTDCMDLIASNGGTSNTPYIHVYLFLRMTLFMRESGFNEQAAGLWQAVLEFVFFRPHDMSQSEDRGQALSAFQQFWEAEVARIGEVGAKGWKSSSGVPVEPRVDTSSVQVDTRSVFPSWVACETHQTVAGRLPGRSLDESDIDDPFRVVLFSDVEHIVSLFWKFDCANALIDGFLHFCHLPPLITQTNVNVSRRWAGDPFIHNSLMDNPAFSFSDWFAGRDRDPAVKTGPLRSFAHQNFVNTVDSLFAGRDSWCSSFDSWRRIAVNEQSSIDSGWVRRVLRLLVDAFPKNDDLAEYSLAVEFVCDAKEAKKCAKTLLKKRSSTLRLYNCYALMERRLGNSKAADNVWATSLSMTRGLSQDEQSDCILLWHTWISEMLEAGQTARACRLLLAMPQRSVEFSSLERETDEIVFSPTILLKIQNFITQGQEIALNRNASPIFAAYTDCAAMLAYIAHGADVEQALQVYNGAIIKLGNVPVREESFTTFTTELLHQYRARLLYHHMRTSAMYKPSLIRDVLTESISQFRHNTIFLTLFAWNESRFRIAERVRDVLREITVLNRNRSDAHSSTASDPVPITTHFFSIYTEVVRPVYAGSTLYSVRAAFEKAIDDATQPSSAEDDDYNENRSTAAHNRSLSSGRCSPSLWKLYVLFELSRGQIQRAKDIFYRGMRACPWSKDLLMLAFTHLRADVIEQGQGQGQGQGDIQGPVAVSREKEQGMEFEELRRVYHVLVEKGLRIHVDIEDLLDEVAGPTEMQHETGNGNNENVVWVSNRSKGIGGPTGPIHLPEAAQSESESEQEKGRR